MKYIIASTKIGVDDYTWTDLFIRKVNSKFAALIVFDKKEDAEAANTSVPKSGTIVEVSDHQLNALKQRFRNDQVDWLFEFNGHHFNTAEEVK